MSCKRKKQSDIESQCLRLKVDYKAITKAVDFKMDIKAEPLICPCHEAELNECSSFIVDRNEAEVEERTL